MWLALFNDAMDTMDTTIQLKQLPVFWYTQTVDFVCSV